MSLAATASLFLPSLTPKALVPYGAVSPSPSLTSFPFLPLGLRAKSSLVCPPFLHCRTGSLLETARSRFVLNVAVSSAFDEEEDEEEEEVFANGGRRNLSPDLKLYVGNLPFNVDSSVLSELFQRAGNVQMAEVLYFLFPEVH